MLICNCALAGTKACENCPSYRMYFGTPQYDGYTIQDTKVIIIDENRKVIDIKYSCPNCGTSIIKEENYCHNCGTKLKYTEDTILKDIKEGKGLKPIT